MNSNTPGEIEFLGNLHKKVIEVGVGGRGGEELWILLAALEQDHLLFY